MAHETNSGKFIKVFSFVIMPAPYSFHMAKISEKWKRKSRGEEGMFRVPRTMAAAAARIFRVPPTIIRAKILRNS